CPGVAGEVARQHQGERRPLALDGPHLHVAAVGGGDVLDDGEPQAGAAGGAVAGGVHAVEALEDALDLLRGDADALVDDRDLDGPVVGPGLDDDGGVVGGVVDRVGHQVAHGRGDQVGHATHRQT